MAPCRRGPGPHGLHRGRPRPQPRHLLRALCGARCQGRAKGFFSKLFSRSPDAAAPVKYQIQVRSEGDKSTVTVLNTQGQPETSANAQRIVRVITDDMK